MELTNKDIIEKVREYQDDERWHPLTCGSRNKHPSHPSHQKLEPIEIDGEVILKCPKCDYTQDYIPSTVFTAIEIPKIPLAERYLR